MDARHPLVRLLLEHTHVQQCHQGVDYLRALIQQHPAVIKQRATLRTIVSMCVTCRKRKAETVTPVMADLPRERLAFQKPPFSTTGVDYFGPFFVTVRRTTEKRWGFLFTCLTTRAVHFHIVPSIDTSSCVMGIDRCCTRCGIPSVIWSDNGTNFVAIKKELLSNINNWSQQIVSDTLVKKKIMWKFNPPSAPHHAGVWEPLVRSFKHNFHAILGNRRLTDEILTFCLVEHCLNAGAITPVIPEATSSTLLLQVSFFWELLAQHYHRASAPKETIENDMFEPKRI